MSVRSVLSGLSFTVAAKNAALVLGMDLVQYQNNLVLKAQELNDGCNFLINSQFANVVTSGNDSTSNTALSTLVTTTI